MPVTTEGFWGATDMRVAGGNDQHLVGTQLGLMLRIVGNLHWPISYF